MITFEHVRTTFGQALADLGPLRLEPLDQVAALLLLAEEARTMGGLAEALGLPQTTTHDLVERLVNRGLVIRHRIRRQVVVGLLPQGVRLVERAGVRFRNADEQGEVTP